jgi:hypothetical protein
MTPDDPNGQLVPRGARGAVAKRPRGTGALATAGEVAVGTIGIVLTATSLLASIGMIVDRAKSSLGENLGGGLLLAVIAAVGVALMRWGFRSRPGAVAVHRHVSPALASAIKQRMLAVASHYGGRVTAAELAAMLGIEEAPAARALEAAAEAGEARMLFSPEGIAVYEFPGLVAHKAAAKEPWEL